MLIKKVFYKERTKCNFLCENLKKKNNIVTENIFRAKATVIHSEQRLSRLCGSCIDAIAGD